MTEEQQASYNMFQTAKVFLTEHADEYATMQPMVDAKDEFDDIVTNLEKAGAKQSANLEGVSDDREQGKTALAKEIDGLAAALGALAEKTKNNRLEQDANVTEAMLVKMSYPNFTTKVLFLLDAATTAGAALTPYGYAPTDITALKAQFQTWRDNQGVADHAEDERQAATKDVEIYIKQGNNLLTDTIDRLVRVWARNNETRLNEWVAVRALSDPGTDTRALTVSVTALVNGVSQPVSGATAVVDPGGLQKVTGEEGMFYVQTLAPGTYTLSLAKPGYLPVSQEFVVADGEMTTVNVVMTVDTGGSGD